MEEPSFTKFVDPNFSGSFLSGVNDLRKDGKFFDVVISVENRDFNCHKVVLAAASNYFR